MNGVVPEHYALRVKFECSEKDEYWCEIVCKFTFFPVTLKQILYDCFISCEIDTDTSICKTYTRKGRYVSKIYDLDGDLQLRFYHGTNNKWTFEDLDTFIEAVLKIMDNDYTKASILLEA
jgi:hypothetical protein